MFLNTGLLHLDILNNFTERTLESFSLKVQQPCRLFCFFAFREVILYLVYLKLHFDFIVLASDCTTYRPLSLCCGTEHYALFPENKASKNLCTFKANRDLTLSVCT